jgi:gliding motility-associated-like protein
VGTSAVTFTNQFGCDSVVTTITTLIASYDIQLTATTCDPALVGVDVQSFTSTEGCDSIVTTTTTLLPNDAVTINATTCDPSNVGTSAVTFTNQFGCDSVVTTITTLPGGQPSASVVNLTSCNAADAGTNVEIFTNQFGCDSVVTIVTTYTPISIDSIVPTDANCNGINGSAVVFMNEGQEPFTYTLTNPNGTTNLVNHPIGQLNSGTYSIEISDANNCAVTESFTIESTISGNTLEVLPANTVISLGESIQFETLPPSGIISWSPSDYLSCNDCPNPISTPDYDITYIISSDDGFGCIAYDTVIVTVNQPSIFVPSAFTPNGDGSNDILYVIDKNISELIYFRIFNRWGEEVFSTDNIYVGWDGTYKNKMQEMDIYSYDLHVITTYGRTVRMSGLISLLK